MPDTPLEARRRALQAPEAPSALVSPGAPPGTPPGRPVRHRARPRLVAGTATTPETVEAVPAPPAPISEADAAAEAQARHDDARTTLLRQVLELTAKHVPQRVIAAKFSVDTRTVRRWQREAQERCLGTFRSTTAEQVLAASARLHGAIMAKLLRRMDAAEASNDTRTWLECVKRVQAGDRDRLAMLERVGAFDNFRAQAPGTHDPNHETPEQVQGSLRDIYEYLLTGKEEAAARVLGEDGASTPDDADADDAPLY